MQSKQPKGLGRGGFTLVELMVSVALISVAAAVVYMLQDFLTASYQRTEEQWIHQDAVAQLSNWIETNISTANTVEVMSSGSAANLGDTTYSYLYQTPDTDDPTAVRVYYRAAGPGQTPVPLCKIPIRMTFYKDSAAPRAVRYTLYTLEDNGRNGATRHTYDLESYINFPNLRVGGSANKSGTMTSISDTGDEVEVDFDGTGDDIGGQVLRFRSSSLISVNINIDYDKCFIATAAYGSYEEPAVLLLRRFRDQILLPTKAGKAFVDTYYRLSPPLARLIAESPLLAGLARLALLPCIGLAVMLLQPLLALTVAEPSGAALVWLRRRRKFHKGGIVT